MRYIFNTTDEQGAIGSQIKKWADEGKIELIEKGQPIVEVQANLERVAKALETLKKSGFNSDVMLSYVHEKTKISRRDIISLFKSQEDFFQQTGILQKK